jgi:phosphate uptake regulator
MTEQHRESRKIQRVGSRSYAVSLPKQWVLDNHLKSQDSLFMEVNDNNELVIKGTEGKRAAKRDITVDLAEIDNVNEFIVFCYVKNIDRIRFTIRKSDYEKIASIRNLLVYLEGYEITAEDERSIEVSFLFHDINVTVSSIMRRMVYLLKLLLAAVQGKDQRSLQNTETAIDKLYHLSKRIIFACLANQKLRKENGIANLEDLFFLKEIVKKIESIGDHIYRLERHALTAKDVETLQGIIGLLEEMLERKRKTSDIKHRLNAVVVETKDKEVAHLIRRVQELCRDAMENFMSIEFNTKYFKG